MAYTLGQAAKATGLNKATIFKALKAGKISGEKDVHGRYVIDPAELHRNLSARFRERRQARNRSTTADRQ